MLFSGWVYDVLTRYAVELYVGHPARTKALSKNKNDQIDAETLANLVREMLRMTQTNIELFTESQRRLVDALKHHGTLRERVE